MDRRKTPRDQPKQYSKCLICEESFATGDKEGVKGWQVRHTKRTGHKKFSKIEELDFFPSL